MQVQPVVAVSAKELHDVKKFIKEYFSKTVEPDQVSLVKQVVTLFNERSGKLNSLLNNAVQYSWPMSPEDRVLIDEVINLARRFSTNDDLVFKELPGKCEDLLDHWEDRLEKLYSFSNNDGSKKIFADARSKVNNLGNDWAQLTGNDCTELGKKFYAIKNDLDNKDFFIGSNVQKLRADVNAFTDLLAKQSDEIKSKLTLSLSDFEEKLKIQMSLHLLMMRIRTGFSISLAI